MEARYIKRQRLEKVVGMLEGKKKVNTKRNLELAKLNLLRNDPGFNIADELYLINKGMVKSAILRFLVKNFIYPNVEKILSIFRLKRR